MYSDYGPSESGSATHHYRQDDAYNSRSAALAVSGIPEDASLREIAVSVLMLFATEKERHI